MVSFLAFGGLTCGETVVKVEVGETSLDLFFGWNEGQCFWYLLVLLYEGFVV